MKEEKRSEKVIEEDKEYITQSLVRPLPMVVKKAEGTKIWDIDGKEYLDFLNGAAAVNVGHNNEHVLQGVKNHMEEIIHPGLLYQYYHPAVKLAKKLSTITPGSFDKRVYYGTSGSGAIDAALKIVREYTGKYKVLSFLGSYHGMTYGALSLSSFTSRTQKGFGPMLPGIYQVPFPNVYRPHSGDPEKEAEMALEYLRTVLAKKVPPEEVAACFIEPIQGDNGFIVPPNDFYKKLKQILDKHNILLVADEIQTGFGRTGEWFAMEHFNVQPDVMVLGKAMASGLPLSAVVARKEVMSWSPGTHVITAAGSSGPVGAALATIEEIKRQNLVEASKSKGKYLKKELNKLEAQHTLIGDVRGKGLLIGVDLVKDRKTKEPAKKEVQKVCLQAWKKGLMMMPMGESVLRIAPTLSISREEIDKAVSIIDESLTDVEKDRVSDTKLERLSTW